jgi:cytochrome c
MAVSVFQTAAYAVDAKQAQDDMKASGCLACHEMDKKKVGPGYKEVAAKFKGKPVEELMASMKSKPVHKAPLQKAADASLKGMLEYIQAQ